MQRYTDWPDEHRARLKELYLLGYSMRQIADELGRTRCAVSGKIKRLRLTPEEKQQRDEGMESLITAGERVKNNGYRLGVRTHKRAREKQRRGKQPDKPVYRLVIKPSGVSHQVQDIPLSKWDLRRMLAEAARNTAAMEVVE